MCLLSVLYEIKKDHVRYLPGIVHIIHFPLSLQSVLFYRAPK